MNSDLLDEYCEEVFGHADWVISWDRKGNIIVTFHKEARQCYLDEMEGEENDNN